MMGAIRIIIATLLVLLATCHAWTSLPAPQQFVNRFKTISNQKARKFAFPLEAASTSPDYDKARFTPGKSVLRSYARKLQSSPVTTKSLYSFIGFSVGDIISQIIFSKAAFSSLRTLQIGSFGALLHGPVGHVFYRSLESIIPGASAQNIFKKVAIEQILYAPTMNSLFLVFVAITNGLSPQNAFSFLKDRIVRTLLASWAIWPLAHLLNFKVVQGKSRLLYINTIQILYNTLLSKSAY